MRKTNKGLLKYILLGIITFGIYPLVVMSVLSEDVNIVASRYDNKRTMHFLLMALIVSPITCGIAGFVWYHRISNRIGAELKRRGVAYDFSAADFWLWSILGSLIVIGPFVYLHKMFRATNLMCENYNQNGCC